MSSDLWEQSSPWQGREGYSSLLFRGGCTWFETTKTAIRHPGRRQLLSCSGVLCFRHLEKAAPTVKSSPFYMQCSLSYYVSLPESAIYSTAEIGVCELCDYYVTNTYSDMRQERNCQL